ncbi:hypothetical protein [Marinicrinis sediminis]|uniref:Uncharacterized protein n=1 Tax=Marinicrinis sediminis TaxID=1652465 RepID=A0ABW5RAW1_9BACL
MRWIKRGIKAMLFCIMVSLVSSTASIYAVQWYIEEQLMKWNLNLSGDTVQVGDLLTGLTQQWMPSTSDRTEQWARQVGEEQARLDDPIPADTESEPVEQEQSEPEGQDALPVFSSGTVQHGEEDEVIISTEDFHDTKDKLSAEDKMQIFSMLITKLPQEELQTLSTYMENGITTSEFIAMKELIGTYVSPEELDELLSLIEKYQ